MNLEQAQDAVGVIQRLAEVGIGNVSSFVLIGVFIWYTTKLKPTLDSHNQLIENNTKAIEAVSASVNALNTVLDKLSDKFIAHEEKTEIMNCGINSISAKVEKIADKGATQDGVYRVEEKVEDVQKDVSKICGKVGC